MYTWSSFLLLLFGPLTTATITRLTALDEAVCVAVVQDTNKEKEARRARMFSVFFLFFNQQGRRGGGSTSPEVHLHCQGSSRLTRGARETQRSFGAHKRTETHTHAERDRSQERQTFAGKLEMQCGGGGAEGRAGDTTKGAEPGKAKGMRRGQERTKRAEEGSARVKVPVFEG